MLQIILYNDQNREEFGICWLLRRLDIYPNAYYNHRKHWKADYYTQKSEVMAQIRDIYHIHNGIDGYRSMTGTPHKIFEDKLKQDFTADKVNQKWCTNIDNIRIYRTGGLTFSSPFYVLKY